MNLGNKLAVGEAVDLGIDCGVDCGIDEVPVPEPARPDTAAVLAVAPADPVAAHAEH